MDRLWFTLRCLFLLRCKCDLCVRNVNDVSMRLFLDYFSCTTSTKLFICEVGRMWGYVRSCTLIPRSRYVPLSTLHRHHFLCSTITLLFHKKLRPPFQTPFRAAWFSRLGFFFVDYSVQICRICCLNFAKN